jgi:hypothetical protein
MLPAVHIRLVMLTACCALSGDRTGLAWAADPYSLCDNLALTRQSSWTEAPVKRRVILAPDLKPEMLLLYPVTVERTFRGAASPLVYLYRPDPEPVMAAGRSFLQPETPDGLSSGPDNRDRVMRKSVLEIIPLPRLVPAPGRLDMATHRQAVEPIQKRLV